MDKKWQILKYLKKKQRKIKTYFIKHFKRSKNCRSQSTQRNINDHIKLLTIVNNLLIIGLKIFST